MTPTASQPCAEARVESPAERVRKLLSQRFQVTLQDGRILQGDFQCLDKEGNLIMSNTYETVGASLSIPNDRFMGTVLIPGSFRTGVQALQGPVVGDIV